MNKHLSVTFLTFASALMAYAAAWAQKPDFSYKFYGQLRGDIFYNSRANNENVDGLFYLYPKDHNYDPDGNDLNATPQGNMYLFYTRLGVDITGPKVGTATTTAKVEIDFRGSGTTFAVPRIRHAYVSLDWGRWEVLAGQTWHPLFGEVSASLLNLSSGAPFQPLNRSPLLRGRYRNGHGIIVSAYAIWQQQYTSSGPIGRSYTYLKNSCIPELYLGMDYANGGWTLGAGVEMLSLRPRTQATVDGKTFKVSERVTSFSAEAHVKYKAPMWMAAAKTLLANNLSHVSLLGGYGVVDTDLRTGQKEYTPFRHSMTWVNFVYGKKWQPGVFLGYLKNLGTGKAITGEQYGVGLDVDQLFTQYWQLSYNLPYWRLGIELGASTAWFGTLDLSDGRIRNTHHVTNLRAVATVLFLF